MPKQRIQLFSSILNRTDLSDKGGRLTNCFIEPVPDGAQIIKRFGLVANTTTATGTGLGIYTWNGNLYQITGTTLYKNGVALGTVDGTDMYYFTQRTDNSAMIMKNSKKMYTVNSSGTITAVTSVNYPATTVPGLVYLDGTYYVMDANSVIYNSALEDPTTWSALGTILAQVEPDGGVAVWKQLNYLVAFGNWTTEIFYDNANATGSPLARMDNAFIPIGSASGQSVAYVESQIFWIGQSRQKGRSVYTMSGLSPQIVSDMNIDRILNADNLSSVYSFGIKIHGHLFYVLTLVNSGVTLVYDLTTQVWSYWTSTVGGVETYFQGIAYSNYAGVDVLQHISNGTAYTASTSTYQDYSNVINVRARTDLIDGGTIERKFVGMLDIVGDRTTTTVNVRYTNDDYQTYSSYRSIDMSLGRSRIRRLGSFHRRAFELQHTDNTALRIKSAELLFGE